MKSTEKIIIAATEIFCDYHFEHATIKMICERADVNIASVNYHFRSKKELYLEVMASIYDRIKHKIYDVLDFEIEEGVDDGLEEFIFGISKRMVTISDSEDFKCWHKIMFRELNNSSEAYEEIYNLYLLPVLEKINSSLEKFFPDMSEEDRLMWVISLISQISFVHSAKNLITQFMGDDFYSDKRLDNYANHITEVICTPLKIKH